MELALSHDDLAFEREVRRFIDRHWSESARSLGQLAADQGGESPAARAWFDALVSRGWSVPSWPLEHGGTGWTPVRRFVWERETAAAETPRMDAFAVARLGPLLCRHGSRAQRDRFLPPIRDRHVRWCRAREDVGALRAGDHYVVRGENVPAPGADAAEWMFCPARAPADRGKSGATVCLLIDLRGPGIRVDGPRVTFEDVQVPLAQRLGAENSTYAGAMLDQAPAEPVAACRARLRRIARMAGQTPAAGTTVAMDDDFQRKYGELEVDLLGLEMLEMRMIAGMQAEVIGEPGNGGKPRHEILKTVVDARRVELERRMQDLMVETLGYYALPFPDLQAGDNRGPIGHHEALRAVQEWRSYHLVDGRSSETQKSIIARSALQL